MKVKINAKDFRVGPGEIVLDAFEDLNMAYPKTTEKRRQALKSIRKQL